MANTKTKKQPSIVSSIFIWMFGGFLDTVYVNMNDVLDGAIKSGKKMLGKWSDTLYERVLDPALVKLPKTLKESVMGMFTLDLASAGATASRVLSDPKIMLMLDLGITTVVSKVVTASVTAVEKTKVIDRTIDKYVQKQAQLHKS